MTKSCQNSKPKKLGLKVTVLPSGAIVMNVGDKHLSEISDVSSNPV